MSEEDLTPEEIASEVFEEEEAVEAIQEAPEEEEAEAGEAGEVEESEEEEAEEEDLFQNPIEMEEKNYAEMEMVESNIREMMEYNKKLFENENYLRYTEHLHQYFGRETKKTRFNKSYSPNGYLLTSRSNKSAKIRIVPSIVVNLRLYQNQLQKEIDKILFEIAQLIENQMTREEDSSTFETLRNKYISCKKQIQEIEDLDGSFQKTCQTLEEKIASTLIELKLITTKRKDAYATLPTQPDLSIKKKIMDFYQAEGLQIPDAGKINQFSKDSQITTEIIESILNWMDASQEYVKKEIEHSEAVRRLQSEIIQHEAIFQFFILRPPRIERL